MEEVMNVRPVQDSAETATLPARLRRRLPRAARYALAITKCPQLAHGSPIAVGSGFCLRILPTGTLVRGRNLTVGRNFTGHIEGELRIGDHVYFNEGAHVSVFERVSIGHWVRFGERVSIHDENHVFEGGPENERHDMLTTRPIEIGDHVWVGANVVITAGAVIGDGSVIAAGSVVTGLVPARVLAGGVPARVIRRLD
jgi:acetyltransferase-like isoleucine patch superfamily enzyme